MTKDIIIIGAGGHAKVIIDLIRQLPSFNIIGVTDKHHGMTEFMGCKVLGDDSVIENYDPNKIGLVNAVGRTASNVLTTHIYQTFSKKNYQFVTLQHPISYVSPDAHLGQGVHVMAGAIIQPGANVADDVIINTKASVDHDASIGAHTHIAPGATLLGGVVIGTQCLIGAGATILPNIHVGNGCIVGAGAVVVDHLPDGARVTGVPAKSKLEN